MKNKGKELRRTDNDPAEVVFRFFIISTAIGLMVGLFEASLLWTTPRNIPLLVPDVGWVIWFLAPLVDMVCFGLLSLVLGWLAARNPSSNKTATLVAVEAAVGVMFVALRLRWLHGRLGLMPFAFSEAVAIPLIWFVLGFIVALLLISILWGTITRFSDRYLLSLRKPLAWGLGLVTVVTVVGVRVFVIRPSFSAIPAQAASPPSGAPNIVFITLDTVRADHLSAYGYVRPTTPNLDRFARTGVLFENAIAPTSWTLASHASMFTGLLPQQHGADWAVPLSSGPSTLAKILRSQGYETAGFAANRLYLQKGWGIAQGFEHYEDDSTSLRHNLADTLLGTAVVQPVYQHFDRFDYFDRENAWQLNERIFRWFRHRPQRPYFVFINYFDAHEPYLTSAPYDTRFGRTTRSLIRRFSKVVDSSSNSKVFNPRYRKSLIAGYDNCLAYLDDQVGKLLKFLRQSPEWQNTIVIITSDHGEEFGRHHSYSHGKNPYREVLHVPLIIAGPGVPRGLHNSHIVATRQLFSTVLDLAGGGKTPFRCYSLARFWNPGYKPTAFDDAVVSELVPINDPNAQRAMISLTTPQWQYIVHRSGRQELYHWTSDPDEKDNLAASSQEQTVMAGLHSRLLDLVSDATGPWRGMSYLQALDKAGGLSRLSLLFPKPVQPGAPDTPFRIGIAQTFFKSQESSPTRSRQPERELLESLPLSPNLNCVACRTVKRFTVGNFPTLGGWRSRAEVTQPQVSAHMA